MLLSIVTLNYKKPDLTLACMGSLYQQFKKEFEKDEIELIIIDNGSDDGSAEKIREDIKNKHYKNMRLIANDKNVGFGGGCNLGAEAAKGDLVLFLNNDTLTKDRGILDMAYYLEKHEDIVILGGQLRNRNGDPQPSGGKFYNLFNTILLLLGGQKFGLLDRSPAKIEEIDWVKGGLFMVKKSIFSKLSGFDEKIFMYTEDMELCYRAKLAGFKTFFYPDVNVVHAEHGSTSRSFAISQIYKGLLYFYKKHKSYTEYLLLKLLLIIKAIIAIVIGTIFRNNYLVRTYKQAIRF